MNPRKGVALVLVSGLLVLLAFLAFSFAGQWRLAEALGRADRSGRQADLAAASGLEYAASRLWQDEENPADKGVAPAADNACDDWTSRLGLPSYARGDRWIDTDGDGAYTAGRDLPAPRGDLNGDAQFDAWSGRLRGAACRFALQVQDLGGMICVNSGETGSPSDDHDADGVLNAEDPSYQADRDANGIDDWRDPDLAGNLHLLNTLANLGAIVGFPDAQPVPFAPPPAEPAEFASLLGVITLSEFGRHVIENRPRGGYLSIEELRERLVPTHYTAADFEKAAPFLTVHGAQVALSVPTAVFFSYNPTLPENALKYERRVPVDLRHTPAEVLRSLLRHTAASGSGQLIPRPQDSPLQTFVRLGEEEADALAEAIVEARSSASLRDWRDLLALLEAKRALFQRDPFVVSYNAAYGTAVDSCQVEAKQDLILTQLDLNWQFPDPTSRGRNTLEVRETPRRMHRPAVMGTLSTSPFLFPKENPGSGGGTGGPGDAPAGSGGPPPSTDYYAIEKIPNRSTIGGTFSGSAGAFRVESRGWREGPAGTAARRTAAGNLLFTTGTVVAGSQQDFTPLFTSGTLGDPNQPLWRLPGGAVVYDGSQPTVRNGVQPFPRFPLVGPDGQTTNVGMAGGQPSQYKYPRGHGGLQLSARQVPETPDGTLLWLSNPDIAFAVPHNEDGIPSDRNVYDPASWHDNAADPIRRAGQDPSYAWTAVTYPTVGTRFSPFGPRRADGVSNQEYYVHWNDLPLKNSSVTVDANTAVFDSLLVEEGTMVFWYASQADTGLVSPPPVKSGSVTVSYSSLEEPHWFHWFSIAIDPRTDAVTFKTNDPSSSPDQVVPLLERDFHPVPSSGWRCVALRFRRDLSVQAVPDNTPEKQPSVSADLFVDGVPVNSVPIPIFLENFANVYMPLRVHYPYQPDGKFGLRLACDMADMDDLCLFRTRLSDGEIRDIARVDRHARSGQYRSQRFRFDPAALPRGAAVRRVAWDAFLPQSAGAEMVFTVSAYDDGGNRIAVRSNAAAPHRIGGAPWLRTKRMPPAASIDYEIEIETDTADPLRDTPVIEEVRIEYGGARPVWSRVR